jgi:hypothetical protein
MKKGYNKMKSLRKNNQTEILEIKGLLNQIKITVVSHSSRLELMEDRISGLEDKNRFEKTDESFGMSMERTCKNSENPSKDQTCKSWALKKKRCKPKVYIIYSTK